MDYNKKYKVFLKSQDTIKLNHYKFENLREIKKSNKMLNYKQY